MAFARLGNGIKVFGESLAFAPSAENEGMPPLNHPLWFPFKGIRNPRSISFPDPCCIHSRLRTSKLDTI